MKKIIALILAMVMALSLVACGQTAQDDKSKDDANSTSAKTFIMGIDAEYPPFSYLDADGNYTGFDVEVCKAAHEHKVKRWILILPMTKSVGAVKNKREAALPSCKGTTELISRPQT